MKPPLKLGEYSGKIFLLVVCKKYYITINLQAFCEYIVNCILFVRRYGNYCKYIDNDVLKYNSKATVGIVQQIH